MTRILYAINGEGMGHALRSKVIIDHLLSKGHEVKIVSSGRAFEFLSTHFPLVEDIHYMHLVYDKNEIKNLQTIYENVRAWPKGSWMSFKKLWKMTRRFKPDIIITDFEPFSDIIAKVFWKPMIAIDNNSMLVKGKIKVPRMQLFWYVLARLIARTFIFAAEYNIIPTFFTVPVRKQHKTYLVPPVIRKEILKAKPVKGDHILVYQTAGPTIELVKTLRNLKEKFIVGGAKEDKKMGNVTLRTFNENQFIDDLRTCKGLITNGGFTLIGEAIYLKKPILTIPVKKQFEQIMNSIYVDEYKYGLHETELTVGAIKRFLKNLDVYERHLSNYSQDGNKHLFTLLDERIKTLTTK